MKRNCNRIRRRRMMILVKKGYQPSLIVNMCRRLRSIKGI